MISETKDQQSVLYTHAYPENPSVMNRGPPDFPAPSCLQIKSASGAEMSLTAVRLLALWTFAFYGYAKVVFES